jgi:hypothetical protein
MAGETLREAAQAAHDIMHECTAVLTASDCAKVAAGMKCLRDALAAPFEGREPTQAMIEAGNAMFHRGETPLNIWRAMWEAGNGRG